MPANTSITARDLFALIGTPDAPVIIDIRIDEDFEADPAMIPGSRRLSHKDWAVWKAELHKDRQTVIACHGGLKLSQGVAAFLRAEGFDAVHLKGGTLAWRQVGLPCVPVEAIPNRDAQGRTVWVTRERPKIDRIACPWLIRRFVDSKAVFLFVEPDQVALVADRFSVTPFDIEGILLSHRGETCTFDTMIDVFGLSTPALDRLARIVRGADTARLDLEPEAAGFLALSLGLSRLCHDDLAQLETAMPLYDALYLWCRDGTDETHNWPATGTAA